MTSKTWKRETKLLLSSDSENEETPGTSKSKGLTVNKDYASHYESWRGKEEIQKYKDRFGSKSLEDGQDSDSESSSESEEELSAVNDKGFLKVLSRLKEKDPSIYDENLNFFPENQERDTDENFKKLKKTKKGKEPFLLKDHERKMILENVEALPAQEIEFIGEKSFGNSYFEELRDIKKEIKSAVKKLDSESDDGDTNLLRERQKSKKEVDDEDEDYKKWLKGQMDRLDTTTSKNDEKELKYLRDYWNDPKLNDGEQFLRDYILNKKYVEKNSKDDYIPSYDEIVHDSDDGGLSGDESGLQQMEEFEQKYNFRFEEPDPEFIKKYPRTVENSIRRKENKRKTERERLREQRKKEKERKLGEMQQLKAFSRKQIMDKIRLLQQSCGTEIDFAEADVDGDFDPDEYDNRTTQIFNEEYYSNCQDEKKPVFSDLEDMVNDEEFSTELGDDNIEEISPNVEKKSGRKSSKKRKHNGVEAHAEQESSTGIVEDEDQELSNPRKKKGRKAKRFLEALEKEKSNLNPEEHKKLKDEYYKLDFEDIIGDIPCRFKYREVVPNDFGLSIDEILQAPDKELNRWSSIKKTYLYRSNEEEMYDLQAYETKGRDINKKKGLLTSIYTLKTEDRNSDDETIPEGGQVGQVVGKKKRKNKNGNHENETDSATVTTSVTLPMNESTASGKKKQRKRKKKNSSANEESTNLKGSVKPYTNKSKSHSNTAKKIFKESKGARKSEPVAVNPDRLLAFGINPTKHKKWVKYGSSSASASAGRA